MNQWTDQQLLREYAEHQSEAAFGELVRRHVDLIYSAALRMVCDSHVAEDVTQGAFVALARSAPQLTERAVLSGWLHRTAQNIAAQTVRTDVRRRAREQEAVAMNELFATEPDGVWERIAPHLDAALNELSEADRDALMLRYFERKSAQEMAQVLGVSDEAAQKRVSRAVERLREFFAKRGVTVGANGLAVVISANAVQAAPAGLALTISTATALAGTAIQTSTAIAMTTLQKSLIAATLAAAVGTGMYEAHQASTLRTQVQTFRQRETANTQQIEQLNRERDDATARQATLQQENERLQQTMAEVPKLRGELTRLRSTQQQQVQTKTSAVDLNDPALQHFLAMKTKADEISRYLEQMPEKSIPELKLLTDVDWLSATKDAKLDTDAGVRRTLSYLRSSAKKRMPMGRALDAFARDSNGQLPADLSRLKPYFNAALGDAPLSDATLDAIFKRYTLLRTGNVGDLPPGAWIIVEKAPVDKDDDSRAKFGIGTSTVIGTGLHSAGDPDDKSY